MRLWIHWTKWLSIYSVAALSSCARPGPSAAVPEGEETPRSAAAPGERIDGSGPGAAGALRRAALIEVQPTPGRIVRRDVIDEIGVTVLTLGNGALVVMKPTDFDQSQILEQSVSSGGHSRAEDEAYPVATLASEVVIRSGLSNHDPAALQELLAGKQVQVAPWISEHAEGIRASSSPQDLETMLQLIYLYQTAPRRDESAFAAVLALHREEAQSREQNPLLEFFDVVSRRVHADHLRRRALSVTQIDAMQLDQALSFYRDRFDNASDFTYVFVGGFDPARLEPLVERYLASLPASPRDDAWRDVGPALPDGVTRVQVTGGPAERSLVSIGFHGPAEWSPDAADDLRLLAMALDVRLREVMREDLAGSRGVFVDSTLRRRPRQEYSLGIVFDCAPDRVIELQASVFETIAQLKSTEPKAALVRKLQERRLHELEAAFRDNAFWLEALVETYEFHTDPRRILDERTRVERIDSQTLELAAQRYLDTRRYVDAVLVPEGYN